MGWNWPRVLYRNLKCDDVRRNLRRWLQATGCVLPARARLLDGGGDHAVL